MEFHLRFYIDLFEAFFKRFCNRMRVCFLYDFECSKIRFLRDVYEIWEEINAENP
jgi:hypothetical protein